MERPTFKQMLVEAAEYYERAAKHANEMLTKHNRPEYQQAVSFNDGRAKGMREALEFFEEYIG